MSARSRGRSPVARVLWVVFWLFLVIVLGVITSLFWAHVAAVAVFVIPLLIVVSVVRSAIRDLRGRRPEYTAGKIGYTNLQTKERKIRHFVDGKGDEGSKA